MPLTLSDILGGIPDFSSKSQDDINKFISQGDLLNKLAPAQATEILEVIRTKLVNAHKLGNISEQSWTDIKAKIREKYKVTMSYETAQERLLSIKQTANETLDAYADRVRKLLAALNAASTNANAGVQEAQWQMNEQLATRKFKQNICDEKIRLLALGADHTTLTDAIAHAVQKQEQIKSSNVTKDENKQASQNQNRNSNNNSNNNKNGSGKYNKKNGNGKGNWKKTWINYPPCDHCQLTNHASDKCRHKDKKNDSEAQNDKPQKFSNSARARKGANSAQIADENEDGDEQTASTSSANNSFRLKPYSSRN